MNKETKEIIYAIAFALGIVALLFGIYITTKPASQPTQTIYLSANLFPITAYGYVEDVLVPKLVFYGTIQPNGTECISSVAVYSFNYTIQNTSLTQIITNPEQVSKIFYGYKGISSMKSSKGSEIIIPDNNNYTLLCPNIINATT